MAALLLVIFYVITGKLGMLLALPPGYASPIFPPAGVALAAVFIRGRSMLPWVFLGAFLLNAWIDYSIGQTLTVTGFVAAVAIAVASTLQAALGSAAFKKVVGYPAPIDNGQDVLRFLLLSPSVCLISSTLSVSALVLLNIADASGMGKHWATWWIGDALGVVVFFPLVMILAGEPRELWKNRTVSVALPVVTVLIFFIFVYLEVNRWERNDSLIEFRLVSQQVGDKVRTKLEEQELFLEQTASLFRINKGANVSREDFRRFAGKPLSRFPMIQAVEWAPLVEERDRPEFEDGEGRSIPHFEIRERSDTGVLHRAGTRPQYFPVTYIEPQGGNEAALGFDIASTPDRKLALSEAIQGGTIVATHPIRLVQEKENQAGVLLLFPVEIEGHVQGIVLTVIRVGDFMNNLLRDVSLMIRARVVDRDTQATLFNNFLPGSGEVTFVYPFDFGGRHYLLQTTPAPDYFRQHRLWQSWGVLSIGLTGAGMLSALLLLGTGYASRVKTQVKRAERRILHLANYDSLTNLPNRTLLGERLQQALAAASQGNTRLALLFIDLDEFKPINDKFGHRTGDLLLHEAARRMQGCVRDSDTVARIGGDEFVVLLPLIGKADDALGVAEKIRQQLNLPFELAGKRNRISSSIGVAIYPEHGSDDETLLKHADSAMYEAKKGGRNTVRLFTEESG